MTRPRDRLGLRLLFAGLLLQGASAHGDFSGFTFGTSIDTTTNPPSDAGRYFEGAFDGSQSPPETGGTIQIGSFSEPSFEIRDGFDVQYTLGLSITDLAIQSQGSIAVTGEVSLRIDQPPDPFNPMYTGVQTVGPAQSAVIGAYLYTVTPEVTFSYQGPEPLAISGTIVADFSVSPVPEPGSAALLALGASALAAGRRVVRRGGGG